MLKPVSILALDEASQSLADAVVRRVTAMTGLADFAQSRFIAPDAVLADVITSIHARRQAPDSALRARDDVSNRELVLIVAVPWGDRRPRLSVLDVAEDVKHLYEIRRLAEFYTIEILCLLPDLFPSKADDYGAAYSLLKLASASEPPPFSAFWLLDATNGNRVRFGKLDESRDAYADAIAGALLFEAELSGALAGAFRLRDMNAAFSSFGFAELYFPRASALQRLESRFAGELLNDKLLDRRGVCRSTSPQLAAKELVVGKELTLPMSRIGVDAGQSLFMRFQPRTFVTEKTRNADEVIAAVRAELKAHRDSTHVQNLQTLANQGEQATRDLSSLLTRVVDETLDRDGYAAAVAFLDAALDPLPDLHSSGYVDPRNLVTEINAATAVLDRRLLFTPDATQSDIARKRIREVSELLQDQKLVADVLAPVNAVEHLAALEKEQAELMRVLPEFLYAEENANNTARNAAREAEAARLSLETEAHEQQLRELFVQRVRAEQTLREVLEERRKFITRKIMLAVFATAAVYCIPLALGRLLEMPLFRELYAWGAANPSRIHSWVLGGNAVFAIVAFFQYLRDIGPRVTEARENLQRLIAQIDATDKSKNAAHNAELQFEYDVAHRRTTIAVLRRTRETAKAMLESLRRRVTEIEELAASFVPLPMPSAGLSISVIDDDDVDAWYARTADDRRLLLLEFFETCMKRSQSLHLSVDELLNRIASYAAGALEPFRRFTLSQGMSIAPEAKLARQLKRFGEYAAPLIELRDDDLQAQELMQRDTTLWIDANDAAFVSLIRRRFPNAVLKTPRDPLRIHALSRVLHYPAYVIGQIEYYRAQYDPARHPESADLTDLLPTELALTPSVRAAYEQLLLGRALGLIHLRDGQLLASDTLLGDSHIAAAHHLASSAPLLQQLESEIAPRLEGAEEVDRGLCALVDARATAFDRNVINVLRKRYGVAL